MTPLARVGLLAIKGYQYLVAGRPSPCRYFPTCSAYAVDALTIHGAVRGTGLAAWRLLRCNPWGATGLDEVPPRHTNRALRGQKNGVLSV